MMLGDRAGHKGPLRYGFHLHETDGRCQRLAGAVAGGRLVRNKYGASFGRDKNVLELTIE